MTFKYKNVYVGGVSTIAGKYESEGPLNSYYDKTYKDLYMGAEDWEHAEIKLVKESIMKVLEKSKKKIQDIDLVISGDLLNQVIASNYALRDFKIPFLGIYSACASSAEGIIIASNMIDAKQIKNAICTTSSHNNASEKQFRYPVEYGGIKPKTTTFTTTGGCSIFLSDKNSGIKVESSTIGEVVDMGVKDVYNMGAVMAPACASTIYEHLKATNRKASYYDLILSGDLGIYGKDILKAYMKEAYQIDLENYDDAASMIYNIDSQDVYSGGSGPACLPLVAYSYIIPKMKEKKLKKVLLVATGALMNSTMVNKKETIPAIAHAISLEVI